MHHNKLTNVLKLNARERYDYFIRKTADFETVYLIEEEDKFISIESESKEFIIPVYPEYDFADFFLKESCENCVVKEMDIYDFIDLLDKLEKENIRLCGFPNNEDGIIVSAREMENDIKAELELYE